MASNNPDPCPHCGAPLPAPEGRCVECGFLVGEARDEWLGQSLGGFTLSRRVSSGPFSAVYEATHDQERAAVKLLHQRADPETLERFRREALAIQRLQHPSVVRLLAQGETNASHPWIAMEFVEGETLRERVLRQLLSEEALRRMMIPLCEALEEAHQKGITHRDLSPRNIMLQRDNTPKLLDFGFAGLRGAETLTEQGVVSGTPAYMAPEQWQGLTNADPRSDLYSLGVIAYECLSGHLPLEAKNPLGWIKKHALEEPRHLSLFIEKPHPLHQTIMRALQKQPDHRHSSIAAFREELENLTK